VASDPLF